MTFFGQAANVTIATSCVLAQRRRPGKVDLAFVSPNIEPVRVQTRFSVVEAYASFSLCAHSWQQTSTVLPPIVTLKEFESSLQSQAAQVFSAMASLLEHPKSGFEISRPRRRGGSLSETLASTRLLP